MAVSTTFKCATARLKQIGFHVDTGATSPVDVSWQDMRDFGWCLIALKRNEGTTIPASFKILANSESDGSGDDVELKAHALGSNPDASDDMIFLEIDAEEIVGAGSNLRYISASVDPGDNADSFEVIYTFGEPRFSHADLTSDIIA